MNIRTEPDIRASRISASAAARTVSEATRYLAAAAYQDSRFRDKVLEHVRYGRYRARAPEFGIDEPCVAEHCSRAIWRERVRDAAMLAVFLLAAYPPLAALAESPEEASDILTYFAPNLFLGVILAGLVLSVERVVSEHYTITRTFARAAFAGREPAEAAVVEHRERQNLVVYGGYSPFVGSGYSVGGWSFSVNLERTSDGMGAVKKPEPFTTRELLDFIKSRHDRIGIGGLEHDEVLFADGRLVRDNANLLFDRGRVKSYLDPETIDLLADAPQSGTRSYLCINVPDWSGELVVSIYLRFKKGESNLFAEATYFILAPPKKEYFAIDEVDPQLRLTVIGKILLRSMLVSPFILVFSVPKLIALAFLPVARWREGRKIRRLMKRNARYNFGALTSIRELGMENYYRVYFQQLDKERHVKTLEQCTMDALIEFLAERNIDTSDLRDRRSAILNNGVIVSGGSINADNMAVGAGAKSFVSHVAEKMAGGAAHHAGPETQRGA